MIACGVVPPVGEVGDVVGDGATATAFSLTFGTATTGVGGGGGGAAAAAGVTEGAELELLGVFFMSCSRFFSKACRSSTLAAAAEAAGVVSDAATAGSEAAGGVRCVSGATGTVCSTGAEVGAVGAVSSIFVTTCCEVDGSTVRGASCLASFVTSAVGAAVSMGGA